jgi:hypothetical protein
MSGLLRALLLLLLLLAGCTPTITCEQTGCAYGQQCSPTSGLCERPETDCRKAPSICRADQLCDERVGECRSLQVSCVGDTLRCPQGQECNTSRGVCQPVTECASDRDCTGRDICDTLTRRCVPPPCADAADCQAGTLCESGVCIAGCEPPDALCPTGQFCRVAAGARRGQCLSECGQDADCPYGRFCDFARRPPTCELEPACVTDEDCRSDEVCAAGMCGRAPCRGDADCSDGQRCDPLTGSCDSCEDDALSPNHTAATALALETGRFVDLRQCPDRPDWFSLALRAGEEVEVGVSASARDAELDVALLDAELRVLAADNQSGPSASLLYQATQDGAVYLRIMGAAGAATGYQLTLERRLVGECRDDPFEENDAAARASSLRLNPGESISLSLMLCGADEDWFALRGVAANAGLGVRLVQSAQPAPLLELWTPDGQRLDIAADAERVLRRAGVAGDYLIRARSPRATSVSYQLSANVRAPYVCPSQGQDDTPEEALPTEPDVQLIQELCPGATAWEVDWLELKPPSAPARLSVKLAPGAGAPAMRMELMERTMGQSEPTMLRVGMADVGRTQVLSAEVRPDQELFIRLSAPGVPGRIEEEPTYQLVYQLE